MTAGPRLTPAQLAACLADADRRVQTVADALDAFEATFGEGQEGFGLNWSPGEAWNALGELHRALVEDRARIATNPSPMAFTEEAFIDPRRRSHRLTRSHPAPIRTPAE